MKRHHFTNRPAPPRGFTLVELLVVIGLILFLVGMSVSVVSGVISTAREKRTKATIKKLDGLLSQRMDAYIMGLKAQELNGQNRPAVLAQKTLFKRHFPQSLDSTEIPSLPSGYIAANDDPATQSSEAMYLFLTTMESFGQPPVDEDAFDSNEVMDTDGDGLKEFVDGWGRPLRFYRWPTRLIRPDGINVITSPSQPYFGSANVGHDARIFFASLPAELNRDPDDPLGWIRRNNINVADFENNFHTPETWSLPLIVSAGADGVLGLYEPWDKANFGHLAQPNEDDLDGILDNISNRNLTP